MKRYIILSIILLFTLGGCKDYRERYYFTDNRVEFNDAVINSNTSGFGYPVLPDVNGDVGGIVRFQVNMTGEQEPFDRTVNFMIEERTTAREGIEYNLVHGTSLVIPANSSFGYIEVEVLPGGTGRRVLAFELMETGDITLLDRYHRIGFRILYQKASPDPDLVEELNGMTHFHQITVGAQSSQEMGGYMDVLTGNVYTRLGSEPVQDEIDLVYLRGSSTGLNLLSPNDNGFTGWSTENNYISQWLTRNHGTTLHWAEPTQDELDMFENAQSLDDLVDAFFYAQATLRDRANYSTNHGPVFRARNADAGDIILYYSAERRAVAMIKVLDWENTTSGLANFEMKSGELTDNLVKMPVTLGGQSSTIVGGLVNLLDGRVYFRDICTSGLCNHFAALPVHDQIDLAFGNYSASLGWSLIVPDGIGTLYGNYAYLGDPAHHAYWPTRNDGLMIRLPEATQAEIDMFENAQSAADLQAIYDYAEAQAPTRDYTNSNPDNPIAQSYDSSYHGPRDRIYGIYSGDADQLVVFRSSTRPIVSVIRITNAYVSNTSSVGNANSRITTEVKTAEF